MAAVVTVGLKAHQGWLQAVAVTASTEPQACWCGRVQFEPATDRDLVEPYHVAAGWRGLQRVPQPADPWQVVASGRRRQVEAARMALAALREELGAHGRWQRAVILTGRGTLPADPERILGSHAMVHIAEGEAVRAAARSALDALHIPWVDQAEKEVESAAGMLLGADLHAALRPCRPEGANAWAREQRVVAAAAWLHRVA